MPASHRRIHLHLFRDQKHLATFKEAKTGDGAAWDDPWEASGYTDDFDDVWLPNLPSFRELLGIGTVTVVQHELRHIYLEEKLEDGQNDDGEHHHFLRCKALGLCRGANHGARFFNTHTGGVEFATAATLLSAARAATPDAYGVRHGHIHVAEDEIHRKEA